MFAALMMVGAFALTAYAQFQTVVPPLEIQQATERAVALQNDDDVVLFLAVRSGNMFDKRFFVPQLVVWKDGKVLYGHFNPIPESPYPSRAENWKYSWGQIDPKKTEELVKQIQTAFRFGKKGGTILDFGPDAGYWTLYGMIEDKIYRVSTWEHYLDVSNLDLIFRKVNGRIDGLPLTKRRFYNIWRKTKNDVCEWGKAAVKENSIAAQVDVESWQMTVTDEEGKFLVHVRKLPH